MTMGPKDFNFRSVMNSNWSLFLLILEGQMGSFNMEQGFQSQPFLSSSSRLLRCCMGLFFIELYSDLNPLFRVGITGF